MKTGKRGVSLSLWHQLNSGRWQEEAKAGRHGKKTEEKVLLACLCLDCQGKRRNLTIRANLGFFAVRLREGDANLYMFI